jgi:hypothetical protein
VNAKMPRFPRGRSWIARAPQIHGRPAGLPRRGWRICRCQWLCQPRSCCYGPRGRKRRREGGASGRRTQTVLPAGGQRTDPSRRRAQAGKRSTGTQKAGGRAPERAGSAEPAPPGHCRTQLRTRTLCGMQTGRTNTPMRQHERRWAVLCGAATRSHRGIDHAEAHVCCLMRSFQRAMVAIEAAGTTNGWRSSPTPSWPVSPEAEAAIRHNLPQMRQDKNMPQLSPLRTLKLCRHRS